MELILSPEQRKIWDSLGKVFSLSFRAVIRSLQYFKDNHEILPVESVVTSHVLSLDPDLSPLMVSAAYSVASGRDVSACRFVASLRNIPLDPAQVHFSIVERAVRIPHLGLVRCRSNRFILPGKGGVLTEDKQDLLRRARFFLEERHNKRLLTVDCNED